MVGSVSLSAPANEILTCRWPARTSPSQISRGATVSQVSVSGRSPLISGHYTSAVHGGKTVLTSPQRRSIPEGSTGLGCQLCIRSRKRTPKSRHSRWQASAVEESSVIDAQDTGIRLTVPLLNSERLVHTVREYVHQPDFVKFSEQTGSHNFIKHPIPWVFIILSNHVAVKTMCFSWRLQATSSTSLIVSLFSCEERDDYLPSIGEWNWFLLPSTYDQGCTFMYCICQCFSPFESGWRVLLFTLSWLSESFITQIQYLTTTCKRLVHLLSLIGCFIVFQTCLSCAFYISVSTIVQIKGCLSPTWWRNFVISRCHVSMACIFLV